MGTGRRRGGCREEKFEKVTKSLEKMGIRKWSDDEEDDLKMVQEMEKVLEAIRSRF